MKRYLLATIMLFNYATSSAQLNLAKASRVGNVIYNIIDEYTGEISSFKKVEEFYDGTKMNISMCDNVIYIKYGDSYFKRVYGEDLNIRWFGCNETRNDNQVLINEILRKYKKAAIPTGTFKISGSIKVPEKCQLKGYGRNSIIKLKSVVPTDAILVYRAGVLTDFKLDCTETALDLKAGISVIPWQNNTSYGEEVVLQNLFLVANYPHLQGVAIKLHVEDNEYSFIAFSKFININIYGFRDGIYCDIDYKRGNGISYINANIFNNITIYNCLRPIRLINSAQKEDILSGKSTIMSNSFSDIIVQHVVGDYPAIFADGASSNNFSAQVIDWIAPAFSQTTKSRGNLFSNPSSNK